MGDIWKDRIIKFNIQYAYEIITTPKTTPKNMAPES
jgi:hypothetical protein